MAYNPTVWRDGDVITAEKMNKLEKGVADVGQGVPAGGTVGQVLSKRSGTDYDTQWTTPTSGGGSGGGVGQSMAGQVVQPTYDTSVTASSGAEIFNDYSDRTFNSLNVAMCGNVASGDYAHAEGRGTTASGFGSHAEGESTIAEGRASHTEGKHTLASGESAHAEGLYSAASANYSHAEGYRTWAYAEYSHASGCLTEAFGICQTVIGSSNVMFESETNKFIVGKGDLNLGSVRANCFRVTHTGVYASGSYNASGADYAEMFEWSDGNPNNEDRAGRFVTLDGEKIRIAEPADDYIIGVVSGNPSVVGDVHDDQWQGMYLYDIFGRPLWEDVQVPDQTIEEPDPADPERTVTRVILPARTEHRQKHNPAYDNTQEYKPRSGRPEWDAVGLLGKLVMIDDGTCVANGWCTVGAGGIATKSAGRTKYRVMSRLDDTHIRILIL